MYVYTLDYFRYGTRKVPVEFYQTDRITDARKKAIRKLITEDFKDQFVIIQRTDAHDLRISMQIGTEMYVRPSIGMKKGFAFVETEIKNGMLYIRHFLNEKGEIIPKYRGVYNYRNYPYY